MGPSTSFILENRKESVFDEDVMKGFSNKVEQATRACFLEPKSQETEAAKRETVCGIKTKKWAPFWAGVYGGRILTLEIYHKTGRVPTERHTIPIYNRKEKKFNLLDIKEVRPVSCKLLHSSTSTITFGNSCCGVTQTFANYLQHCIGRLVSRRNRKNEDLLRLTYKRLLQLA